MLFRSLIRKQKNDNIQYDIQIFFLLITYKLQAFPKFVCQKPWLK